MSEFHLPGRKDLSRREAQIMEILYRLGAAGAADVHARMADPPSYSTVRKQLELLEMKGEVAHAVDGRRYVYRPVLPPREAALSAARSLVQTFFSGSASELMAALIGGSEADIPAHELDEIMRLVRQAQGEGR